MTTTVKKKVAKKKAAPKKKALAAVKPQEVAAVPADRPLSPLEQIKQMKEMGIQVSEMRELLDLQKEHNAMMALQSYNDALAAFKAENIEIPKDKHVSYTTDKGTTEYQHSSLPNILEHVVPALSRYGLSHNWFTDQGEGLVAVTCVLTHRDGHSEKTTLKSNPDTSGGKNGIQAIASAVKYLQRYTLTALLGLAEKDQFDDDGRTADPELCISADQETVLQDLIDESKADKDKFLEYMRCATLGDIPDGEFDKAKRVLEKKKQAQSK